MTREKQPSLYTRSQILKRLRAIGLSDEEIQGLQKGLTFECWGEDKFTQ